MRWTSIKHPWRIAGYLISISVSPSGVVSIDDRVITYSTFTRPCVPRWRLLSTDITTRVAIKKAHNYRYLRIRDYRGIAREIEVTFC